MEANVITVDFLELALALTTNGAGIVLLGLLFQYSLKVFSIHNSRNLYLYFLFGISLIELLTHLFTTVIQYYGFFGNVRLGIILYSLVFVVNSIFLIAWILYLNDHMRRFIEIDASYRWKRRLLSIPVGVLLSISLINMVTPVIFSYDGVDYIRLPAYYLTLLIPIGYLLYGFFLFAKSKHRRRIYQQLPFISMLLPIVLAHVLESKFINLCCIPLANTITLTLLVLTNVNHRSSIDAMTGLYSRQELYHVMDGAVLGKPKLVGIMMDLDHFKQINDNFGHLVGDDALVDFSHILKASIGARAAGFRYAGDEFIVLITNSDPADAENRMAQFYEKLAHFNATSGNVYQLEVSYGITAFEEGDDVNSFIARMDKKMYENKMSRRHGEESRR